MLKGLTLPYAPAALDAAMAYMDADGSGEIEFDEFLDWWLHPKIGSKHWHLANVTNATAVRTAGASMLNFEPFELILQCHNFLETMALRFSLVQRLDELNNMPRDLRNFALWRSELEKASTFAEKDL